ncbi:MAG: ferrochelatase, partial [Acidimicrobiaceae bacterium]|nr:ferrochelatase [Acidimicrobiaceae bacterium]
MPSAEPAPFDHQRAYDAVMVVSFGGPEGPDDVIPFLENVVRGSNVGRSRLERVAEHYLHFGGVSPINAQNRALIAALEEELGAHGPRLPVYWGNRNWAPYLRDTLARMEADGVRRALAFVTSAYSSYSGCRAYLDDIEAARAALGGRAPVVDKIRAYFDDPGFVAANAERLRVALVEA